MENDGLKRMWNRRFKSVMIWLGLCVGLIFGNSFLDFDKDLLALVINKGSWMIGLLIIGLSGTDLMKDWIQKYQIEGN